MIPGAHEVSGGTEIVCRCRYCPDSRDQNHGHMYIKVPQESDDPILFHCFKCQTSGALDSRTLLDWGIYDPSIAVTIDKINKIGVNINQLTRLANSTGSIYEDKLNHEFLELEKLRNSIYEKYI